MIKKLKVSQLRVGMFIHDLDIGWMDHPFLQKRFQLSSTKDIEKIVALKLQEVYIDTTKGLDVEEGRDAAEIRSEIKKRIEETASPSEQRVKKAPYKEEWQRASQLKKEAFLVVSNLMADARLGRQIETERMEPLVAGMIQSVFSNQDALLGAMRIRNMDKYTFEHSVSVAVLVTSFCKTMEMPHDIIQQAAIGGLLHDIGKSLVPLDILNKPGRLTEDEFVVMRAHVDYSHDILKSSKISEISSGIIFEHHERYDGSGYPVSKHGDGISLYGRMAAIVDVYDALTSNRCYHQGKSPHWVLGKLVEWSKYHFDPKLVQLFIRCVGIYPVGTLVLLQSGRLAVVTELNDGELLRPVVKIVYDKNKRCHLPHTRLDLARQLSDKPEKIIGSEYVDDYPLRMHEILAP